MAELGCKSDVSVFGAAIGSHSPEALKSPSRKPCKLTEGWGWGLGAGGSFGQDGRGGAGGAARCYSHHGSDEA